MIKMVVFDMAGTTVDEDNIVYKTLHKVINDAGFAVSVNQVLAEGAGKEKLTAIKDIIKATRKFTTEPQVNEMYNSFIKELAFAYANFELKPQDGAEQVFKILKEKGIIVILNTGYNLSTANNILGKLNWRVGIQFDILITASDVANSRPEPDMIISAMQKFELTDPLEIVKVGNSIIDIEEGKNAGCGLTIGITTGAHSYQQLASANPHHIIHHLIELLPLLN